MNQVSRLSAAAGCIAAIVALAGCGGATGSPMMVPITVSLSSPTVVVPRNGAPTRIQILITSTSETALVSVTGLPGGVQVTYKASDTNPSGQLTFIANASASAGTSMPIINVNSAGQTATLKFTLIVSAASMAGATYQPRMYANTSGATIEASDSMMYLGVFSPSLPHVIFSFGTAPE
jgi:hypothetical protein